MFLLHAWDERDNARNTLTSWEEKSTGNTPWELPTGAIAIAHAALGNFDAARHRASRLARCQRGALSAHTRWLATTATKAAPPVPGAECALEGESAAGRFEIPLRAGAIACQPPAVLLCDGVGDALGTQG